MVRWLTAGLLGLVMAGAEVSVVAPAPKVTTVPDGGKQTVRTVSLANEVAGYTLSYDTISLPGRTDEIRSHWWAWTTGMTTLGMTSPGVANWYFQGFFNWTFDDESLHKRPATFKVLRDGGQDGAVEFAWDTPMVTARLVFALADGSDKLVMFGSYEPKSPVARSSLKFGTYPTGFEQPRSRTVTTALRTARQGERVDLDLSKERWLLFEDTTAGRHGEGSAGLSIGTPEAFSKVSVGVGEYGLFPLLELAPNARAFTLALYSYPALPQYETTRAYYRAAGDREAAWLATLRPETVLPTWELPEERVAQMRAHLAAQLDRPAERWRPDPTPPEFAWAQKLPDGPLRTVLFCPRWAAYETMELARRLEMQVRHLYFDSARQLAEPDAWPYAVQTGIGSLGQGAIARQVVDLLRAPETELYLLPAVHGQALTPPLMRRLLDQVRAGRGLLLVGDAALLKSWPAELFATVEPGPDQGPIGALTDLAWEAVPGFRPGERGRVDDTPPLTTYQYGRGRVVTLRVRLGRYSAFVPQNDAIDGLDGAMDRALAIAARAALLAGGRLEPRLPNGEAAVDRLRPGATIHYRLQDDLDRSLGTWSAPATPATTVATPPLPYGRSGFLDYRVVDSQGRTLRFGFSHLPAQPSPLGPITLNPCQPTTEPGPPVVPLAAGGTLDAALEVGPSPPGARLRWEVFDCLGRLLAATETPAGSPRATLELTPPVTVAHHLDVSLLDGQRTLAHARRTFTIPRPHDLTDYTALLWTYPGGEPVLRQTMADCYQHGAGLQDLCHMGGYDDRLAAREYAVAAASGLRLIPYVTRIAGEVAPGNQRSPGLHDPAWRQRTRDSLTVTCRQAAPYAPAAFTLGDENYLVQGSEEVCLRPDSIAAFRDWLGRRYGNIEALNAAWGSNHASFESITPMLLGEAVARQSGFAPWMDFRRFMDHSFADAHEDFADTIRQVVPGARVGWDGFLGYQWQSGYDFARLTERLELNQSYNVNWLMGELIRSFKRPNALVGKWGNAVADNREGFDAWVWDGLLSGDNSVWWWTSWGCDYIPFNPDLSLNAFGEGFFRAVRETSAGPGKLLLHAQRDRSGIGVLYSQDDLFAATLAGELTQDKAYAGSNSFLGQHRALLETLHDLGYQYHHLSTAQLEAGDLSVQREPVFILPLAACLSDQQVAALRRYVEAGGTLLVDGRAGLLTGPGQLRARRALDELLGVTSEAGQAAFARTPAAAKVELKGTLVGVAGSAAVALDESQVVVLEPGLRAAGATALGQAGETPAVLSHAVGRGRTVLTNLTWSSLHGRRAAEGLPPLAELLAAILEAAGRRPFCQVTRPDGGRTRSTQQVQFFDGALRYLAVSVDLLQRGIADQPARLTLPEPAYVYDLRAGKALGRQQSWEVTLSRARPLVYSLLPYEVDGVTLTAPPARRGTVAQVPVKVSAREGQPQHHVVRLEVIAPGAAAPHREYSQNVVCAAGAGQAVLPLALSDAAGRWRLLARDVASGVQTESTLEVR